VAHLMDVAYQRRILQISKDEDARTMQAECAKDSFSPEYLHVVQMKTGRKAPKTVVRLKVVAYRRNKMTF